MWKAKLKDHLHPSATAVVGHQRYMLLERPLKEWQKIASEQTEEMAKH